jgi:Mor family transcriptional regulator
MLVTSIDELLSEGVKEITLGNELWPGNFHGVLDCIDYDLREDESLKSIARAVLLQFCLMSGGSNLSVPTEDEAKTFLQGKLLFDASAISNEAVDEVAQRLRIKNEQLGVSLKLQRTLRDLLPSWPEQRSNPRWHLEVLDTIDQFDEFLQTVDLDVLKKQQVMQAILLAFCRMRIRGLINIPSCSRVEAEARKRLIFAAFNGVNARELSRKYHISLTHVYRSIKSEYKRRRDGMA